MSTIGNQNTQPAIQEFGNLWLSISGGNALYVGTDAQIASISSNNGSIAGRSYTSVNTALGQCVSGRGDTIFVLPGYTENIATADAWSALGSKTDVTIVGMGRRTNRPTFTWTAAGSTVLFDAANFRLLNCNLYLAGAHTAGAALTVAAPITASAAGWEISDCDIFWGFDADQIVAVGITVSANGDFGSFNRNFCYAETAAVPTTTFLQLTGADYLRVWDTKVQGAGSTTTLAPVQFVTTASLGIDFRRSTFQNQLASSIHAVTGMAGLTGTTTDCSYGILDNATLVGFVTPGSVQHFRGQVVNLAGEGGAPLAPVSA